MALNAAIASGAIENPVELDATVSLLEKICNLESTLSDKIVATNEEKLLSKPDCADDPVVQAMQARMLRMEKNYRILAERYIAMRQHTVRMQQQMQLLKVKILELTTMNATVSSTISSSLSLTSSGERERPNSVVLSSEVLTFADPSLPAHRDFRSPSVAVMGSRKEGGGSTTAAKPSSKGDEIRSPRSPQRQRQKEKKDKSSHKDKTDSPSSASLGGGASSSSTAKSSSSAQSASGKRTITVGSMMDALHIFSESSAARSSSPPSTSPRGGDAINPHDRMAPDSRARERRANRKSGEPTSGAAEALAFSSSVAAASAGGAGGGSGLMTWFQALNALQPTSPTSSASVSAVASKEGSTPIPPATHPNAGGTTAPTVPVVSVISPPSPLSSPSASSTFASASSVSPASTSSSTTVGSAPAADMERLETYLARKAPPPSPPSQHRVVATPFLPNAVVSAPIPVVPPSPVSSSVSLSQPTETTAVSSERSSGGTPSAVPSMSSVSSRIADVSAASMSSRSASASPSIIVIAQSLSQPSTGSLALTPAGDVIRRGPLFKIGAKVVRKYAFELVLPEISAGPSAPAALAWKFSDRGARLGAVLLRGAKLITSETQGAADTERLKLKPFSFAIQPVQGPKLKKFFFAAPSKEEFDGWISNIGQLL